MPSRCSCSRGDPSRRPRSSVTCSTGARSPALPPTRWQPTPEDAARRALELIEDRCDLVLIHFDVDVIDFTDAPLSENWGRNEGLSFEAAMRALRCLLDTPKLAALTITELNPDHTEEGAGAIEAFAAVVAQGLAERN